MISVIIPTYNRNDLLQDCLLCLTPENQGLTLDRYEVIVTDDSAEGAAKALIVESFPWVRWVKGPGKGPAANRNNGVHHANGNWVLFTDDDCLPGKGWLKAYDHAMRLDDDYQVLEGRTIADRPQRRYNEEAPINETGGNLWSCNFGVKKDAFERLGGFDELFPFAAMEDVDFHRRVAQQSKVKFVPAALVVHPWRKIASPWRRLKMQFRSRVHFYRKHKQELGIKYRFEMLKSFIVTVVVGGIRLIKYSFRGWKEYIAQCLLRFGLIFAF